MYWMGRLIKYMSMKDQPILTVIKSLNIALTTCTDAQFIIVLCNLDNRNKAQKKTIHDHVSRTNFQRYTMRE